MDIVKFDHGQVRRPQACHAGEMVAVSLVLNLLGLFFGIASPLAAEPCRIAVLGDSLTAGYGVAAEDAFPAQLEAALRGEGLSCGVVNAGVSGDTSAGGAARVEWVLEGEPSHLIVELGGNDALRALPIDQLRANLRRIIEAAHARDVPVLLVGMLAPPNLGPSYGDGFRAVYADLVREYDLAFYPFFLEGVVTEERLMSGDGIHPNVDGVAAITRRILPTVLQWLNEPGEGQDASPPRP